MGTGPTIEMELAEFWRFYDFVWEQAEKHGRGDVQHLDDNPFWDLLRGGRR